MSTIINAINHALDYGSSAYHPLTGTLEMGDDSVRDTMVNTSGMTLTGIRKAVREFYDNNADEMADGYWLYITSNGDELYLSVRE